jgi:biopolymer transport protein ExbD
LEIGGQNLRYDIYHYATVSTRPQKTILRIPNYRGTQSVTINMTPMIDVTFLLIIFFLVSSHLAKQENFLKLDLPSAGSGLADFSDRPTVTVQVLATGEYQLNGQSVSLEQIRRVILSRMKTEGGPLRIRIRTDKTANYEHIGALLKICAATNSTVVFAVYGDK